MEKKYKFVVITSVIILILGIIAEVIIFYQFDLFGRSHEPSVFNRILYAFSSFQAFSLRLTVTSYLFAIWEVLFLFFLLVGLLFYITSKGKNIRLLAFVYSVLFINNLALIVWKILFYTFWFKRWDSIAPINFFYIFLGVMVCAVNIFLAFKILKILKSTKELDIETTDSKIKIKDTIKWQRFFHFLIDTLIIALVFIPIINSIFDMLSRDAESLYYTNETARGIMASRYTGVAIFIVLRFLYYPIFEIIFGSTPAKFLTESVVLNAKAERPNVKTIFARTLCRSIPFDAVSYLTGRGWHDSLSETYVVKEKRTGYKANRLLWILPFLAIYLPLAYFGDTWWSEYKSAKYFEEKQKNEILGMQNLAKNINTNQIYLLNDIDNYDYGKQVYAAKIENIDGDNVLVSKLYSEYVGTAGFDNVASLYRMQKDSAQTEVISREKILKAVPATRGDLYNSDKAIALFANNITYQVVAIFDIDAPFLVGNNMVYGYSGDSEETKLVRFLNLGKSGRILSIKNIKGDTAWETQFPLDLQDGTEIDGNLIVLKSKEKLSRKTDSECEITVEDSRKKQQKYILTFTRSQANLVRIE